MLQEGMFQDAVDWIKKKGKDAATSAKEFLEQLKQEMGETKEGAAILTKMVSGKELTPEEATALSAQAKDLAKGLPLLAIVAAPGGGIAAPVLVKLAKKFGIDLMPTAFQESVMKITKRQLRRIISEVMSDGPEVPDILGAMGGGKFQPREEPDKRDKLMAALQKEWGLKHVKTSEEFDGTSGGIWLSGEEGETAPPWVQDGEDFPIFDYYIDHEPYTFGIHPEFEAFVIDKFGFAPEWNDPGTLMLWSLD